MVAAVTATFGNLAAYSQTKLKRLLGLLDHRPRRLHDDGRRGPDGDREWPAPYRNVDVPFYETRAIEGLLYYLVRLHVHELGRFAVVALIRNEIFSEDIDDYNGLANRRLSTACAWRSA